MSANEIDEKALRPGLRRDDARRSFSKARSFSSARL